MWQDSSDEIFEHAPPKDGNDGDGDNDLDKFILWREIKIQIKILRKSLDEKKQEVAATTADPKPVTGTSTNTCPSCRRPITGAVPPSRLISRNKAIQDFEKIKAAQAMGWLGRGLDNDAGEREANASHNNNNNRRDNDNASQKYRYSSIELRHPSSGKLPAPAPTVPDLDPATTGIAL